MTIRMMVSCEVRFLRDARQLGLVMFDPSVRRLRRPVAGFHEVLWTGRGVGVLSYTKLKVGLLCF